MPELQALYQEIGDRKVNVVGIVADGMHYEADARYFTQKYGINYLNIVPNQKFMDDFVRLTVAVPTSILVNDRGEIIGQPLMGYKSKAEFRQLIEGNL